MLSLVKKKVKKNKNGRLRIIVTCGFGLGRTEISAFDAALRKAGVANYNLIPLSSVIPPHSKVIVREPAVHHYAASEHGKRLFVVIAKQLQNEPGLAAYAGLGWVQSSVNKDKKYYGRGLFVEHHGYSKHDVQTKIRQSLEDMIAERSEGHLYGKQKVLIAGGTVEDEGYACAVVVAFYQSEGWTA